MSQFKSRTGNAVALLKRAITLFLIVLMGLGFGMGVKGWLVPLLPASVAHALGVDRAESNSASGSGTGGREVAFWKSSMIPNFVSPKPGLDPMNMDLIPVYLDEMSDEQLIALNPETVRNMGLRTVSVEHVDASRMVRTIGEVDYAEPLLGDVTLKVGGWVEDLFIDYIGEQVTKGQPLFSVYSPDLYSTQEEFLISEQQSAAPPKESSFGLTTSEIIRAHDKLLYWDVPESEIQKVKKGGRPIKAITFVSPFDGWVIDKQAYRGMHMKPGARYYRIADLSKMWVYASVFEYQLPDVHVGQTAKLSLPYRPGEVFEGKVIYIYPYVNPETRQIRVRLEFPNPDLLLKPQMYADVELEVPLQGKQTLIPQDAVIDVGLRKQIEGESRHVGFAYVKVGEGKFEPREVQLGEELEGGRLQIVSGLNQGEQVVVSGQFQLDSERRVKESNLAMLLQSRGRKKP